MGEGDHFRLVNEVALSPEWDDGAALFVAATADTLALSPLAAAVVGLLQEIPGGAGAGSLADRILNEASVDLCADDLREAVGQVLVQFERLGLIGRLPA